MTNSKVVGVVTGGAGQIGRAIANELLEQELVDEVWCVDRRLEEDTAEGIRFLQADLRDPLAIEKLFGRLPDRITFLINAVGGEMKPPVEDVVDVHWPPGSVWGDIMDLNVTTPYRVTRALQSNIQAGGAICNVSSIAATMPWVVSPAYGAAKSALEHWSRSLAVLLADRGIRVNAVRPGFVWSKQWAEVSRSEFERIVEDRVPLRQLRTDHKSKEQLASDVGKAIAFLCSDGARHLTAQFLEVDGGASLLRAAR